MEDFLPGEEAQYRYVLYDGDAAEYEYYQVRIIVRLGYRGVLTPV